MSGNSDNTKTSYQESYKRFLFYTGEASKIGRQLAFAEGAILWFYHTNVDAYFSFILISFTFLLIYFILDLLQYFIGGINFESLACEQEKDPQKERAMKDIKPMRWLYYAKFVTLFVVTIFIISLFLQNVGAPLK